MKEKDVALVERSRLAQQLRLAEKLWHAAASAHTAAEDELKEMLGRMTGLLDSVSRGFPSFCARVEAVVTGAQLLRIAQLSAPLRATWRGST
jgi:hypothetical protein